ncbi:pentatricopeptide repeat-containing protein At3g62470, mitochondrial-like [Vicia villosa]|uniref:pentatricopeptide repeat-containing protein At3g62470, mitochondrial-like n=1 Tax=Vicia villosa TaxID=3911 RepID=UPI00273B38AE|nr:pentatricopeptide repeat-containing protein At3g62470, mitochondrial-like [Vicia villosa]
MEKLISIIKVISLSFGTVGEVESDAEGDVIVKSSESCADPDEVDRVCKVIDELFALDRNMEAVLDECGVMLSHDLVVDVLHRFKHARKPGFRFFCWAGKRPGFEHDSRTYNSKMDILGKTTQFETMVALLEEMGEKGFWTMETFAIAIKAFASAKERKKAVGIFDMMKFKIKVGVDAVNFLLDSRGVSNGMIDKGFVPDIVAHNIMLQGLLRCQKKSDSIKLFEGLFLFCDEKLRI